MKVSKKELSIVKLHIDWLRTYWQKIHYLAWNGRSELRREWIKEITDTYELIRPRTAWVLQAYLYAHETKEGLSVNSDWLITYLASNVLMSQAIAEYYALDKMGEEGIASPTETMNYFARFSHLVLYTLHCIRHLHREKEMQEELKRAVAVRRPPFAEVSVDFSLSLSETLLYVLSEYAYREIGVHRELVLLERLTRQLRYELPLYAASEFYRDHLYHVIDVCLLGELLLRSRVIPRATDAPSRTLVEIFNEKLSKNNSPVSSADDKRKQTKSLLKSWREKLSKNNSPVSSVDDSRRKQTKSLLKNWYVAALCHDLGYVVERASNLLEPVHAIKGPGLEEFREAVDAGLKLGRAEISRAVKSKLPHSLDGTGLLYDLKKVEPTDHGIAGWLHLSHWLDEVKDSPDQKESPDQMEHALNAIVRHNLPEQQVKCCDEPLTFLLMLCDHLQEWGRPCVGPDPLARGVMEALRFSEQPNFDQKVRVERLFIKGLKTMPPEQPDLVLEICGECWETGTCQQHCLRVQTQIEAEKGIEFILKHVEAREGDFEPAISWLLMCRDLQCFGEQKDSLPFDFDLRITMEHTPSRIWDMLPWRPLEMDLLQEFASNYEPAAYLCQWVEKARQGTDGIKYVRKRETGFEAFTIHLNKLGHPLPRGLSSDHRKEFFTWKWQRLRQQYIDLSLGPWFPKS